MVPWLAAICSSFLRIGGGSAMPCSRRCEIRPRRWVVNGAMLELVEDQPLKAGERTYVVLSFSGKPEFVADVLVQHIVNGRVGIEFYDMSPEHFSTLATLIDQHLRSR